VKKRNTRRKEKKPDIADIISGNRERMERILHFIRQGVMIVDPLTTYIDAGVKIGEGTVIHPFTVIEKRVRIGKDCCIGPFARIRSGSTLKDRVGIGNFVEVVRSTVSEGSKAKHLTYLGDTFVESKVNIGAGTIIANYDGKRKCRTRIKQGAFIGSGSILVAPVKIGKCGVTGAGAVVTKHKHVPDGCVVVGVPARILKKKKGSG
jgi:bifunctional UDP-N-acetylglucosamine pyrophosphorylase/glucosamine-1-phosphate N-acetyltransferase